MNTDRVLAGLERVRTALRAWRRQRRKGDRIPEEIWRDAEGAARQYGLNRVSKALGLDYKQLKRRTGGGAGAGETARDVEPVFVELEGQRLPAGRPGTEAGLACVVELEKGNGVRMRICVREAVAVDWGKLKEAFLGA